MAALKQSPRVSTDSLALICAHDLRVQIWTVLAERVASPNELTRVVNEPVGNVAYHFKVLRDAGLIELVDTRPVRGSTEHFYRAIEIPYMDEAATAARTIEQREAVARYIWQRLTAEAQVSLNTHKFCERPDHVIGRMPLQVDEQGWNEMAELMNATIDRSLEIQVESAQRVANGESAGTTPVRAVAAVFEMPGNPERSGQP